MVSCVTWLCVFNKDSKVSLHDVKSAHFLISFMPKDIYVQTWIHWVDCIGTVGKRDTCTV